MPPLEGLGDYTDDSPFVVGDRNAAVEPGEELKPLAEVFLIAVTTGRTIMSNAFESFMFNLSCHSISRQGWFQTQRAGPPIWTKP